MEGANHATALAEEHTAREQASGTLPGAPVGVLQLRALLRGDLRQLWPLLRKFRQTANARMALRKCTTVGRYCRVDGKVYVENNGGKIIIGERVSISGTAVRCELVAHEGAVLEIGDQTSMNYGTSISAHQHVRIGRRCLIGNYTNILDNNYHDIVNHSQFPPSRPVYIGDDVWICGRVLIAPGVTIGDQATIAAGSVVRSNVPARTVVSGNPARVIARLPKGAAPDAGQPG
jgi:UDP-3-O-[3-hydroxymyristoyl] glucosamine N-acyltransferase